MPVRDIRPGDQGVSRSGVRVQGVSLVVLGSGLFSPWPPAPPAAAAGCTPAPPACGAADTGLSGAAPPGGGRRRCREGGR